MRKSYFVYILTNKSRSSLYIGITSNLDKRLWEHKQKLTDGFTKKYNVHTLVYYEEYQEPIVAIEREKQLKKWSRVKKDKLIASVNPEFEELVL